MATQSPGNRSIVDVHYEVEGDMFAGIPMVLIHGVGSSQACWNDVAPLLPRDRAIIRYDLRGHGRSAAPDGPWTIDDFVSDHMQLLRHLSIDIADTVGFSLGGLIAQRVAAKHPEVVKHLVVIGAVAGRTEQERSAVLARLAMVEAEGPAGAARKSVDRWYSAEYRRAHPQIAEDVIARMEKLDPVAYTNAYRVLATTDLVDDLHRIKAPLLAMTGEFDVGSPPRMSQAMAQRTGGRAVVLPGSRHDVLDECPQLIAKEIAAHVR
jgi:pimeloyl-ACP methyl ester carboxylesterase